MSGFLAYNLYDGVDQHLPIPTASFLCCSTFLKYNPYYLPVIAWHRISLFSDS